MDKDEWRLKLRSCFDDMRIIEQCKAASVESFEQFYEFIAEPAFEALSQELKQHSIKVKYRKSKGNMIQFQINFPRSRVDNFHYVILLPRNSVELNLKLLIKGRRNKNSNLETSEGLFMEGVPPSKILKLDKEDLVLDIIERYKNFSFRALTSTD